MREDKKRRRRRGDGRREEFGGRESKTDRWESWRCWAYRTVPYRTVGITKSRDMIASDPDLGFIFFTSIWHCILSHCMAARMAAALDYSCSIAVELLQ